VNEKSEHGRNVAILSYLWIPGWLLSLILHGQNKTSLGAFHLRQTLGIWLISLLLPFPILRIYIAALVFVMWLLGLVSAAQEEEKAIPFIGQYFQDWFKGL
jgi:uncharacterized membrane protein